VCWSAAWCSVLCAGAEHGVGCCVLEWGMVKCAVWWSSAWCRVLCAGAGNGVGCCVLERGMVYGAVCWSGAWGRVLCAGEGYGVVVICILWLYTILLIFPELYFVRCVYN